MIRKISNKRGKNTKSDVLQVSENTLSDLRKRLWDPRKEPNSPLKELLDV
jgi:hypothetical protein